MQVERDIVYALQHGGRGRLDLYLYDGPGVQHGIWRNDRPPLRFFKHLEQAIAGFLHETLETHC